MDPQPRYRAYNYVEVTPSLATSGVVAAEEFARIAEQGFRVVINLLPDESQYAVPDEASIVAREGMRYVHIPIDIDQPTRIDYERFEAAMDACAEEPVWVHCAANWRVSAFVGIYGRRRLGWSQEIAEAHVRGIWKPTEPWTRLAEQILGKES